MKNMSIASDSAGNAILVGNLDVSNVGNFLTVTYDTTAPGGVMAESHLHVGDEMGDFPLTKGNPTPGQFAYSVRHDPSLTTCQYGPIDVTGLGSPLMIAVHAKVEHRSNHGGDANLAANGSFEVGVYEGTYAQIGYAYLTGGSGTGYISDWSLTGTINWFDHILFPPLLPSDGERFVNFKAVFGVPASLSQDVSTVAGQTYEVGFDLCSNPGCSWGEGPQRLGGCSFRVFHLNRQLQPMDSPNVPFHGVGRVGHTQVPECG